jgi:hypothetical protein
MEWGEGTNTHAAICVDKNSPSMSSDLVELLNMQAKISSLIKEQRVRNPKPRPGLW